MPEEKRECRKVDILEMAISYHFELKGDGMGYTAKWHPFPRLASARNRHNKLWNGPGFPYPEREEKNHHWKEWNL